MHYGCCVFCFQAEDGIRDLVRSRGLGDVYKRQEIEWMSYPDGVPNAYFLTELKQQVDREALLLFICLSLIHI